MEIDALITELSSGDVAGRRAAAEALSRDKAATAVVPLVHACGDPDEQVRELANATLEELGPPPHDVASQLAAQLNHEGPTGYWAATLLGRLLADAAQWSPALGQAIRKNPDNSVRQRSAWALGQIGPAASAAIPQLEAATQDNDPRLARLAADALEKINAMS